MVEPRKSQDDFNKNSRKFHNRRRIMHQEKKVWGGTIYESSWVGRLVTKPGHGLGKQVSTDLTFIQSSRTRGREMELSLPLRREAGFGFGLGLGSG